MTTPAQPTLLLPVSVIVMVHALSAEELSIFERCLASLQWADEVLVFDNDSGLDWQLLQKKYRFTLQSLPGQITDFAATRNTTLTKAHHDWVFCVDSDEVVAENTALLINDIIKQPHVGGVYIHRQDVFHGRTLQYGEAAQTKLLRLFKKSQVHFVRPVHEVAEMKGQVSDSQIQVTHYAHHSINDFIQSVSRYAYLEAQYRVQQKQPLSLAELFLYPVAKWFVNGIIKGGILDGWRGIVYLYLMSFHSWWVRIYLYELEHQH